ncbi:MAG: VOC family protein [Candidatus Eremiobacteraeota bacterium]|nr:VOC family protein [Candidatus Eremiobacteraeota bacterium]MBC5827470.1 VOC family protein [Candidatus Eremiobacteraeota bacterium]
MELEPYLHFNGNCEEALNFYKGIFGGEITSLNRYAGSPMEANMPAEHRQRIMHANFKSPTLKFMGADGMSESQAAKAADSRISLSLGTSDEKEAERVFNALAAGGSVDMPLQDTFWGAKFGTLTDKYGIDWMINCQKS